MLISVPTVGDLGTLYAAIVYNQLVEHKDRDHMERMKSGDEKVRGCVCTRSLFSRGYIWISEVLGSMK